MTTTTANTDNTDKGQTPEEQNKPDATRVKTVTPDNDSGKPGAPATDDDSANKGKGPKGEDL